MNKKDPIIFYQYFATTDPDYFKELLVKRFKKTGHNKGKSEDLWFSMDAVL